MTVSVICRLTNPVLLACLYLNLSKNSSSWLSFTEADAKVRQIFEPPKLFEENFSKSFHWLVVHNLFPFQYFNLTAFLSRKRMQNYCFTTYLPNIIAYFFATFCNLIANSLICRCVIQQGFSATLQGRFILHLNIITRTRICIFI